MAAAFDYFGNMYDGGLKPTLLRTLPQDYEANTDGYCDVESAIASKLFSRGCSHNILKAVRFLCHDCPT
ncbi:hypothetical protein QN277_023147 [Acacia crassicarpa]|uniref:Uncharacterized protein n=1 Tax=Acacia crassicarpa TaxID=499986 RepID=A0AAE1JIA7_9FABA|nr:hypothetical protein QN277_023147 [Acacia crassicarpa]